MLDDEYEVSRTRAETSLAQLIANYVEFNSRRDPLLDDAIFTRTASNSFQVQIHGERIFIVEVHEITEPKP